jgi:hypothetical protein
MLSAPKPLTVNFLMNETALQKPLAQRSPVLRFIGWLCTPRILGRMLCVLVCLITLVGLLYLEEDLRGKWAWDRYERDLKAQGVQLHLSALIPPPVPDDQNFAMTPFLAPLYDYLPGSQTPRDTNAVRRVESFAKDLPSGSTFAGWRVGKPAELAAWLADFEESQNRQREHKPESATSHVAQTNVAWAVLAALKGYDPLLEELRTASQRPHSRFNVRYEHENFTGILMPHLSVIRRACKVLQVRALAELAAGQTEAAFRDVGLILSLADSVKTEPFLFSHLWRMACYQNAVQVIWEGLAQQQWSGAQLQALQQQSQSFDFLAGTTQALRAERAGSDQIIAAFVRDPKMIFSLDEPSAGQGPSWVQRLVVGLIPRGWWYQERINYDRAFQQGYLNDDPATTRRVDPKMVEHQENRLMPHGNRVKSFIVEHRLLVDLLLPLFSVWRKAAYVQTVADQAALACALEQYRQANGEFPDTLARLRPRFLAKLPQDVISGEPLKYRRTNDGRFVLYSVGWNRTDDGGAVGMTKGRKPAWDLLSGDWVWRYPAR